MIMQPIGSLVQWAVTFNGAVSISGEKNGIINIGVVSKQLQLMPSQQNACEGGAADVQLWAPGAN